MLFVYIGWYMNKVYELSTNFKSEALLQDQARHAEHVRKTKQFHAEIKSDRTVTALGTLRRYTQKTKTGLYSFLALPSTALLWLASEVSNASQGASGLLMQGLKSIALNLTTAPVAASSKFSTHDVALTGSLADRFILADDPDFVSDQVAEAIELHRDVAFRDITLIANQQFIGPQLPQTMDIINEFQNSAKTHADYHRFQDAILEERGLVRTDGACNAFGVAVCPHQLNALRNEFGNAGGTPHKVWTYTPIQSMTSATALDTKPTMELRPNYA